MNYGLFYASYFIQTSEKAMISREKGENKALEASEEVIYKIDVPANRCFQYTSYNLSVNKFYIFLLITFLKNKKGSSSILYCSIICTGLMYA